MFVQRERDIGAGVPVAMAALFGFALFVGAPAAKADSAAPAPSEASTPIPDKDDGFFRNMLKKLNIVTDVGEPKDFVVKARPSHEEDYLPIVKKTVEHKTKVKTPDELKAMSADLDTTSARHDAVRNGFEPARRAVAEQKRAEAAKAAAKRAKAAQPAPTPTNPQ